MDVVNELISKQDGIVDFVKLGVEQEDFTGDKEKCLEIINDIIEKRESLVNDGTTSIKQAVLKENNKTLLRNVVKGIEKDTKDYIKLGNVLVKKYVNGITDKSEFYKKCNIKVKTKYGLLYIGIELLIFFGTLLVIYLIKK